MQRLQNARNIFAQVAAVLLTLDAVAKPKPTDDAGPNASRGFSYPNFEESKHPRAKGGEKAGQFVKKGGGGATGSAKPKQEYIPPTDPRRAGPLNLPNFGQQAEKWQREWNPATKQEFKEARERQAVGKPDTGKGATGSANPKIETAAKSAAGASEAAKRVAEQTGAASTVKPKATAKAVETLKVSKPAENIKAAAASASKANAAASRMAEKTGAKGSAQPKPSKWIEAPLKPAPAVAVKPYDESKFRKPTAEESKPLTKEQKKEASQRRAAIKRGEKPAGKDPIKAPGSWIDVKINPDPKADVQMTGIMAQSQNKIIKYSKEYVERCKANQQKWPTFARPGHPDQLVKIPPQATNVHLSTNPNAKILATYIDATGNEKEARHPAFNAENAAAKFARNRKIAGDENGARNKIKQDTKAKDARTRQAAQAEDLALLGARIGGGSPKKGRKPKVWLKSWDERWKESAPWALKLKNRPEYGSDGILTLRGENVQEEGGKTYLRFIGKESKPNQYEVTDPDTKKWLKQAKDSAGNNGYLLPDVSKPDISKYVKDRLKLTNTKDFRTLQARERAEEVMATIKPPKDFKEFKAKRKEVGTYVSGFLNNGPDMALRSYVDPALFSKWNGFDEWAAGEKTKAGQYMGYQWW